MFRLFWAQAVFLGLWAQTAPAVAEGREQDLFARPSAVAWVASAMAELGGELAGSAAFAKSETMARGLAVTEPAVTEPAAEAEPVEEAEPAEEAEPVVSWSDCEVLSPDDEAGVRRLARPSVGMSRQLDDEDPTPMCDGGTRCSPVPASPSRAVAALAVAKALAPPAPPLERHVLWVALISISIGGPEDGFPDPPFEPPRFVA